ncbi:AT-hook motif nuclear-localized protein 1 [Camellia lanceoleosa]|uniref:AT-hook motif nuclear-localized protein 1 n=1 Tax=Camellia lanceoleosa TaxID=1840588 RepID=A0ACC0I8G2_9ERIC|nr:AT-hook motif nuclear-localized protein 1 [Camellia lanceoleosa]
MIMPAHKHRNTASNDVEPGPLLLVHVQEPPPKPGFPMRSTVGIGGSDDVRSTCHGCIRIIWVVGGGGRRRRRRRRRGYEFGEGNANEMEGLIYRDHMNLDTSRIDLVMGSYHFFAKILSFSQKGPRGICVLSANGTVSNVTIRQPGSSGGVLTYEG